MQEQLEQNEIDSLNRYKESLSNFNTDFDLGLFVYIFKRNILWVLLVIGISLLLSFLYIRYTAPVFLSSSDIQIEKSNQANQLLDVEDYYQARAIIRICADNPFLDIILLGELSGHWQE